MSAGDGRRQWSTAEAVAREAQYLYTFDLSRLAIVIVSFTTCSSIASCFSTILQTLFGTSRDSMYGERSVVVSK
jgi:hypothetical protein